MKQIFVLLLILSSLIAAPAIEEKIVFEQPDGTTFEGYLRGDSAFHWIESGNDVIIYNPKDKYYYKAVVDREKGLIPSNEKAGYNKQQNSAVVNVKNVENIDKQRKEDLRYLYKKARNENSPR